MLMLLLKYMWISIFSPLVRTFGSTAWFMKLNMVSWRGLGFKSRVPPFKNKLLLPSFCPRVGLIDSHVRGGVTVYVDCQPSLHQFELLVLVVGA
jgi:hypothetical protein